LFFPTATVLQRRQPQQLVTDCCIQKVPTSFLTLCSWKCCGGRRQDLLRRV
jgi:hypothetical protein